MPHFVIEYSLELADDGQVETMLDTVYQAALETALFDAGHIRLRAVPLRHYRNGSGGPFVHAQLRIKPGRSDAQKKGLSAAVLGALRDQGWAATVMTVEVVEMDAESYAKHPN
ncbi:MAG: 5-carboxymethyl-2-hydroxymuconate Delta-isomerase [Gammaproteobacteria bacterium]|nr:5-carboxymethyl-2-hydroxymuconate Delta-isomerase [Gammaproteobacteria bacterium]